MTKLDSFTRGLLTNPEVLEVQQDALGTAGRTVWNEDNSEIMVKKLADGSTAVGLFNRNADARLVAADWTTLGLSGPQRLRDLWRNADIGTFVGSFSAKVRPHGVVLVRAQSASSDGR